MKYDIRINKCTVAKFNDLETAEKWQKIYQRANPNKLVGIVKDYGKAGE
ncbi:hypothetical protein [Leuconostoc citreum]|nr:hypothetical protein [Leuconostoc citreum]MCQ6659585.1 hypothetical protein [Leuconostoc citreum]QOY97101.1 hypothetical protein IRM63_06275 [Leuconostoc citreum]